MLGAPQAGTGSVRQAVERTVRHGLHGIIAKPYHLGQNAVLITGMKVQAIADRGKAGQPLHLDDKTKEVGDGAADTRWLNALESRVAGIQAICETRASHWDFCVHILLMFFIHSYVSEPSLARNRKKYTNTLKIRVANNTLWWYRFLTIC
jgi:hypothetical protein